jgi:hypothetical protein
VPVGEIGFEKGLVGALPEHIGLIEAGQHIIKGFAIRFGDKNAAVKTVKIRQRFI